MAKKTQSTSKHEVIRDEKTNVSLTAEKQYQRGKHPNSQANLTLFEKGISGNPGGRPVKYAGLKNALYKWADEVVTYWFDGEELTLREQVIYTIWNKARRGDPKMIEILATLGCLDER
jgi:hypothetical protein